MSGGVVILGANAPTTNAVHHSLARETGVRAIVLEAPVPRRVFLERRVRKLGLRTVAGQIAFVQGVVPILGRLARERIAEIARIYELDTSAVPTELVTRVASANEDACKRRLHELRPEVVVVHGTRILSPDLLASVRCPVLNVHAGITPLYRGVHGGYWALAAHDPEHCGVTVHLVDRGIDTGGIVAQARIHPTPEDNYATYPWLQLGEGIRLLVRAVRDALAGTLVTIPAPAGASRLWSHPTLAQYVRHRLLDGVR